MYYTDFRIGALGVIKYANFDSVIIGSSMLENTSANEASRKLGENFINISFCGSTPFEKSRVLQKLFREKKYIKTVILSVDICYILKKDSHVTKFKDYGFLYDDDNPVTNMAIYFGCYRNLNFFYILKSRFTSDFDMPTNWYKGEFFKACGGFKNWISFYNRTKDKDFLRIFVDIKKVYRGEKSHATDLGAAEKKAIVERLNEDVISLARSNPKTIFHVIMPPYSRLTWKLDMGLFFRELKCAMKYLVEFSKKYENLRIHGFDNETFTADITNYGDPGHYCPKINEFMLDAIKNGKHILTPENIDDYLEQMEEGIKKFDLKPFYDLVKCLPLGGVAED
jgi:hypothetical protein